MTAPAPAPLLPDPSSLAALTPALPGASVPGGRGYVTPDGTRIVIVLDRHDMAADGVDTHIGIGCTAYEVDATGAVVGTPVPRWVHTAPIDVIASGERTLAEIQAILETEGIQKVINRRAVHAELDALNLPTAPPALG